MIVYDQRENGWSVLLGISLMAFFAGGTIAGRHRRRAQGALYQGVALAAMISGAVVVADIIWHAVLSRGVAVRTVELWVGGPLGAAVTASLGALLGRWLVRRAAARKLGPPSSSR
jgi:hypothetical protein